MLPARPLLTATFALVLVTIGLAVAGSLDLPEPYASFDWTAAHGALAIPGVVLPGLAFLHLFLLQQRTRRTLPKLDAAVLALQYTLAGLVLAGSFALPARDGPTLRTVGWLLVLLATITQLRTVLKLAPRTSLVDVDNDPLSKGDDACMKHIRIAHFILPVGVAAMAAAQVLERPASDFPYALETMALHLILAGYGLLSTYGLSHLVVPRLSGVPAIAAGAIKGELHTSLLGITLIAPGFLLEIRGLVIAGGAFLFFGAFTFMGVLGANIMRNKSKTQRVTPEFNYIPWTFTGVFWLVAGVLLGIFLNAVPDLLDDRMPWLTFAHVHAVVAGAFVQLLLGFAHRILPEAAGRPPPRFARSKLAFYAFNTGLAVLMVTGLQGAANGPAYLVGAFLVAAAVAASFKTLATATGGP